MRVILAIATAVAFRTVGTSLIVIIAIRTVIITCSHNTLQICIMPSLLGF